MNIILPPFYTTIFFYLIGVLSDVYEKFEPWLRLILQSILIFLFIYLNKSILSNLDIEFINFFIQNHIVNSLFLSFCTLVLINGLNLLDGKNGLVSINLLIIIFILFLINQKNNNFDTTYVFLIIIILVFLIFNLFGKCFLGDSGVYVFGFLITYLVVETYNKSSLLSSIFIVNLLWLPCFENLFSIIRRFLLKKVQITNADKRHLHHLLDRLLIKKYKLNNNLSSTITGIVINFYYLLTITLAYNFMWSRTINIIILLFNVLFYVIVYIELLKTNYKIKII